MVATYFFALLAASAALVASAAPSVHIRDNADLKACFDADSVSTAIQRTQNALDELRSGTPKNVDAARERALQGLLRAESAFNKISSTISGGGDKEAISSKDLFLVTFNMNNGNTALNTIDVESLDSVTQQAFKPAQSLFSSTAAKLEEITKCVA